MKKILVIQQKMIGDVLLSSLLCDNLRLAYPEAQIDYLVNSSTAQVIENNPNISRVIHFTPKEDKNLWQLIQFSKKLKAENYDLVIDVYSKLQSWIMVYLSAGKQRIAFKKKGRAFLYTHPILKNLTPTSNLGLAIEHRLALLAPLQLPIELKTFPTIHLTELEKEYAETTFSKHHIPKHKKTVMISVLGSEPSKTYPLTYMAELVDYIGQNFDVNILFNYFPKQAAEAQFIYDKCSEKTQNKIFFEIYGQNLREFLAIMNACDIIVGNDGGAINMAKALGKKSFIVFSPWIEKKDWATFEDGVQHTSVHLKDYLPEAFENKSTKQLKKEAIKLYDKFTPDLILPKLNVFLNKFLKPNEAATTK